MAGVAEVQNRQARPVPPAQPRGPPPPARPRFQPVDREKVCPHFKCFSLLNFLLHTQSISFQ